MCTGSVSPILEVLKALQRSSKECSVIGITMTQRDPEGHVQVARLDMVESETFKLFPKMCRLHNDAIWTHGGVVTRFYTL